MTKRRRLRPKVVPHKTTIMFKGGEIPVGFDEVFGRIFWKSQMLASQAKKFWESVKEMEGPREEGTGGIKVDVWKDWTAKTGMSIGQFYNMIHGLQGAGMIERRGKRWHIGTGFMRQLEMMLRIYSVKSGYTIQLEADH
jgi:hypothetical protein